MSTPVVLMDTTQVRWLKVRVADALVRFDETVAEPPTYTPTSASAWGNTPAAPECRAAWEALVDSALGAAGRLRTALLADVERLDQVIRSFEQQDDLEADRINAVSDRMTVISSHAHNDDKDLSGPVNDRVRAGHLGRLIDHAARAAGPVVVGSDDNVSLHADEQISDPGHRSYDRYAPEVLGRYEAAGFANVGDVGGTIRDESIDHIHARGMGASEAALVDGGPSDHDGQVVSYTVYDW